MEERYSIPASRWTRAQYSELPKRMRDKNEAWTRKIVAELERHGVNPPNASAKPSAAKAKRPQLNWPAALVNSLNAIEHEQWKQYRQAIEKNNARVPRSPLTRRPYEKLAASQRQKDFEIACRVLLTLEKHGVTPLTR